MPLTRVKVQAIHADIRTALEAVATKHQVTLTHITGRFSDTQLTTKLELSTTGKSQREEALPAMLKRYKLSDKEIDGDKIVGYNSKAKRYPWIVQRRTGRVKVTTAWVKEKFQDEDALTDQSMFIDSDA